MIFFIFEQRMQPERQYRITVVESDTAVIGHMMERDPKDGFAVIEVCDSNEKIMDILQRYMNMEGS